MNVHSHTLNSLSHLYSLLHAHTHTHTQTHAHFLSLSLSLAHSEPEYLCIFAFVYFSVVPACRVIYSRVQNESERGGSRSSAFCTSAQTSLAPLGPLPTATGTCVLLLHGAVQQPDTQSSQIKHDSSISPFALSVSVTALPLAPSPLHTHIILSLVPSPAVVDEVLRTFSKTTNATMYIAL